MFDTNVVRTIFCVTALKSEVNRKAHVSPNCYKEYVMIWKLIHQQQNFETCCFCLLLQMCKCDVISQQGHQATGGQDEACQRLEILERLNPASCILLL